MPSDDVFNHDLLLNDGDIARARRQYPSIADFLDWPELRKAFLPHEERANERKSVSRQRGIWGIAAALIALWLAAFEPRLHELHAPVWLTWAIAGLVVAFGIAGILLGSHILRGNSKHEWLHHRAATERLRQLHFQFLVRRAVDIGAGPISKSELMREREKLILNLDRDLQPGVKSLTETIIADGASVDCWLVKGPEDSSGKAIPHSDFLRELVAAYGKLRFEHQMDYAMKKLAEGHGIWPPGPVGQASRIHVSANGLTVAVIAADFLALICVVQGSTAAGSFALSLQTFAIMAAISVLALRVLDEGLRPRADIARYRNYRAEIAELHRQTSHCPDIQSKLALMERMEQLSYRELREFLTQHQEASFVL